MRKLVTHAHSRRAVAIAASLLTLLGLLVFAAAKAQTARASACTITQDASSPYPVWGNSTVKSDLTTAAFTPPSGALMVLALGFDAGAAPAISVSDTAGNAWTRVKGATNTQFEGAYMYEAPVTHSASDAVKVSFSGYGSAWSGQSDVRVLDGTAADQSTAASSSAFLSGTQLNHGITTTATGSWVLMAGSANAAESTVTPLSTTATLHEQNDTGLGAMQVSGKQASATGTPGTETIGWTVSTSTQETFAAKEILPATTCGTQQPPAVTTSAASGITSSAATLNGTVNPEGASTTYQFQYGTTTGYGSVIPASPGSAGSGSTAVNESANLTGLNPSTTYHYRLTAVNSGGTGNGADQQFTTSASGGTHFMDFGPSAACPDGSGTGCAGNPNAYPLAASACASTIVPYPSERIPENATQNATLGPPTTAQANYGPWADNTGEPQMRRDIFAASGQYTGNTDSILEWAACSEGWNENWARAESVIESSWHQSTGGDVMNGCAHSFGILQVRDTQSACPIDHDGWGGMPYTTNSTAFAAEFQMSYLRACFDGSIDYLYGGQTVAQIAAAHGGGTNPAGAGWQYVAWGCVGSWFSGDWYSSAAQNYISAVQNALAAQSWNGLS